MDITKLIPAKLRPDTIKTSIDLVFKKDSIESPKSEANPVMDTVTISDEAKKLRYDYQELLDELERSRESSEGAKESSQDFIKCLLIAQRIMSGDRVPIKDQKFLAEKQPDLFLKAMIMKTTKADPKKNKSLIEDEEDDIVSDLSSSGEIAIASGDDSPNVDVEVSVDTEE